MLNLPKNEITKICLPWISVAYLMNIMACCISTQRLYGNLDTAQNGAVGIWLLCRERELPGGDFGESIFAAVAAATRRLCNCEGRGGGCRHEI